MRLNPVSFGGLDRHECIKRNARFLTELGGTGESRETAAVLKPGKLGLLQIQFPRGFLLREAAIDTPLT